MVRGGMAGGHPNQLIAKKEHERVQNGHLQRLQSVKAVVNSLPPRTSRPSSSSRPPSRPTSRPTSRPSSALRREDSARPCPSPISSGAGLARENGRPSSAKRRTDKEKEDGSDGALLTASFMLSPSRRFEAVKAEMQLCPEGIKRMEEELKAWYFNEAKPNNQRKSYDYNKIIELKLKKKNGGRSPSIPVNVRTRVSIPKIPNQEKVFARAQKNVGKPPRIPRGVIHQGRIIPNVPHVLEECRVDHAHSNSDLHGGHNPSQSSTTTTRTRVYSARNGGPAPPSHRSHSPLEARKPEWDGCTKVTHIKESGRRNHTERRGKKESRRSNRPEQRNHNQSTAPCQQHGSMIDDSSDDDRRPSERWEAEMEVFVRDSKEPLSGDYNSKIMSKNPRSVEYEQYRKVDDGGVAGSPPALVEAHTQNTRALKKIEKGTSGSKDRPFLGTSPSARRVSFSAEEPLESSMTPSLDRGSLKCNNASSSAAGGRCIPQYQEPEKQIRRNKDDDDSPGDAYDRGMDDGVTTRPRPEETKGHGTVQLYTETRIMDGAEQELEARGQRTLEPRGDAVQDGGGSGSHDKKEERLGENPSIAPEERRMKRTDTLDPDSDPADLAGIRSVEKETSAGDDDTTSFSSCLVSRHEMRTKNQRDGIHSADTGGTKKHTDPGGHQKQNKEGRHAELEKEAEHKSMRIPDANGAEPSTDARTRERGDPGKNEPQAKAPSFAELCSVGPQARNNNGRPRAPNFADLCSLEPEKKAAPAKKSNLGDLFSLEPEKKTAPVSESNLGDLFSLEPEKKEVAPAKESTLDDLSNFDAEHKNEPRCAEKTRSVSSTAKPLIEESASDGDPSPYIPTGVASLTGASRPSRRQDRVPTPSVIGSHVVEEEKKRDVEQPVPDGFTGGSMPSKPAAVAPPPRLRRRMTVDTSIMEESGHGETVATMNIGGESHDELERKGSILTPQTTGELENWLANANRRLSGLDFGDKGGEEEGMTRTGDAHQSDLRSLSNSPIKGSPNEQERGHDSTLKSSSYETEDEEYPDDFEPISLAGTLNTCKSVNTMKSRSYVIGDVEEERDAAF